MFRSILVLFFFSTSLFATDGPVPPPSDKPIAKLTGPTKAKVGEQLKYTTEGSVGQDIQFSISPPTTAFEPVKLLDGKDTPGVIYTPSRPGTYYIYLMLNANNKTAYALNILVIEGNVTPLPDPDKIYFPLKDAIKADRQGDPAAASLIDQMESVFGQFETIADASSSWMQFEKTFKETCTAVLGDKLPASRKAIGAYLNLRLVRDASTPFNKDLVKMVGSEIVQTIKLSK